MNQPGTGTIEPRVSEASGEESPRQSQSSPTARGLRLVVADSAVSYWRRLATLAWVVNGGEGAPHACVAVLVVVDELDGVTSSVADWVTPPPDSEIVTRVSAETDDVKMLKPPRVVPAGTIMPFGTNATAGLVIAT